MESPLLIYPLVRTIVALLIAAIVPLGCSKQPYSNPHTISLIEQIDEAEPAGPWRLLFAENRKDEWLSHASGLNLQHGGAVFDPSIRTSLDRRARKLLHDAREHGEFVQTKQISSIQTVIDVVFGEFVLVGLQYENKWRGQGVVEIRLLSMGEVQASVSTPLQGRENRLQIEVPRSGADILELRHHLPPGTTIPLVSIIAMALPSHVDELNRNRASTFLSGALNKSEEPFIHTLSWKRNSISRGGRTIDCISITGADTLEFILPDHRGEPHFRFWFGSLWVPFGVHPILTLEAKERQEWKVVESWIIEKQHRKKLTEVSLRAGALGSGCRNVRFTVSDPDALIGVGEPILRPSPENKTELPKNLILIDLDTMRADRLGSYGYSIRNTSSRLDSAFAARGFFQFSRAYSASPWTLPATAKFLSSRYLDFHSGKKIPRRYTMLPEILRDEGYYCVAFTGGGQLRNEGFARGFHDYRWSQATGKVEDSFPQAEQWLRDWRRGSFFLFLHTFESHQPYTRDIFSRDLPHGRLGDLSDGQKLFPKSIDQASQLTRPESLYVETAYDGGIRKATDAVVDFFSVLDDLDLWRNTVVVLLSDHGEEFWNHFDLYAVHGHSLYREMLDVPFLIMDPDLSGTGLTRIEEPVSTVDLLPTVTDLLGISWFGQADGISLRPLMLGRSIERSLPILATLQNTGPPRVCLISESTKYIEPLRDYLVEPLWNRPNDWVRKPRYYPETAELFSLRSDPFERNDLANTKSDLSDNMSAILRDALHQTRKPSKETILLHHESQSENLKHQLRALGYLDDL